MKQNGNALVVTALRYPDGGGQCQFLPVPVGEIVALLGPNGAGKTTLLDMVLGSHRACRRKYLRDGPDAPRGRHQRCCRRGAANTRPPRRSHSPETPPHGGFPPPLTLSRIADVMSGWASQSLLKLRWENALAARFKRLRFALALLTDPQPSSLTSRPQAWTPSARRDFWQTMHTEAERGCTVVFATHYLQEADDYAGPRYPHAPRPCVADGTVADMTATQDRIVQAEWLRRM